MITGGYLDGMGRVQDWALAQIGKPHNTFTIDGVQAGAVAQGLGFLKLAARNREFGPLQVYISFTFPIMPFDDNYNAEGVLELALFSYEQELIDFLSLGIRPDRHATQERSIAALITLPLGDINPRLAALTAALNNKA